MREIKFRAWDKIESHMVEVSHLKINRVTNNWMAYFWDEKQGLEMPLGKEKRGFILMQFTGLKDKNGLQEVYEGDIIDTYGKIKGNIYEIKEVDKDQYDLVIQGFGTKDWLTTYQNAVDRGCKDSE